MNEEARQARNKYYREYYQKNKQRIREANERYWLRKSCAQEESEREKQGETGHNPAGDPS